MKKFGFLAVFLVFLGVAAWGQLNTFYTPGDWNDSDNWTDGVPSTGDNVIIDASVTLVAHVTVGDIIVNSTITGPFDLTVDGDAIFNSGIDVASLTVGGTADIGADIITTGTQRYAGGVVTLTNDIELTGTTVTFNNAIIGGGYSLIISGNALFGDGANGVDDLEVAGESTIEGDINTTGSQTYTGKVIFIATSELIGSRIIFQNDIEGGTNVTVNANLDISANTITSGTIGSFWGVQVQISGTAPEVQISGYTNSGTHNLDAGTKIVSITTDSSTNSISIDMDLITADKKNLTVTDGPRDLTIDHSDISTNLTIENGADVTITNTALTLGTVTIDGTVQFNNSSHLTASTLNIDSNAALSSVGPSTSANRWTLSAGCSVSVTPLPSITDCYSETPLGLIRNVDAIDGGNNDNVFMPDTYTWIGEGAANDWDDPDNWFGGNTPPSPWIPKDNLIIDDQSSGTNNPTTLASIIVTTLTITNGSLTLGDDFTAISVSVASGTIFDLDNQPLDATSITNNGTLHLGSGTLTVPTAASITNNGLITTQGATVTQTPSSIGGTVQYMSGARSWELGNSYNDLIVESGGAMNNTASLTVSGTAEIGASITTTGNQSYKDLAFNSGTLNLTSNGGSVTASGIVSGTGTDIEINALHGIELKNEDNTFNGIITLNNSGGGATGEVYINSINDITVSGQNTAAGGTGDNGILTVTTRGTGNIIIGTGGIEAYMLVLKTGLAGNVSIGGIINISGGAIEGEKVAAIYINTNVMDGDGDINLTNSGAQVCAWIDDFNYEGLISGIIHFHSRRTHIVYSDNDPGPGFFGITNYLFIDATSGIIGTNPIIEAHDNMNIYIYNVANALSPNTKSPSFEVSGSGFIEFRGGYHSSGTITLKTDSETIRLSGANINLTGHDFTLTDNNIVLVDAPSSISANGITLGSGSHTINGDQGLSLTSNLGYDIEIHGNIGNTTPVGQLTFNASSIGSYIELSANTSITTANADITFNVPVNGAGTISIGNAKDVIFTDTVNAAGFSQAAGSGTTVFNDTQNYTGAFTFIGTNLTVFGSMSVGGMTTVNNSGRFTVGVDINCTGGLEVNAIGAGDVYMEADITAASAGIAINSPITLTKSNTVGETTTLTAASLISFDKGTVTGAASLENDLILQAPNIHVKDESTINNGGVLTVNGDITNDGSIIAPPIPNGGTAIHFNSNYFGTGGSLIGSTLTSVTPYIDFYRDVELGVFTHNGAIIRFVGIPGTDHSFSSNSSSSQLGTVEITTGNTVTLQSSVLHDGAADLVLHDNAVLRLDADPSNLWSWQHGQAAFGFTGYYGSNGKLVFNENARLETRDFYIGDAYTVDLLEKSFITAGGNVTVNNTFEDGSGTNNTIDSMTLTMTGAGSTLSTLAGVRLGNIEINAGGVGVRLVSDILFAGTVTINGGGVLDSNNNKITLLPRPSVPLPLPPGEYHNIWDQKDAGSFIYRNGTVEFGESVGTGEHTYLIQGNTTWWTLACHEKKATLKFSNYKAGSEPHQVYGSMVVYPFSTRLIEDAITLTRADDYTDYPAIPEWIPPDDVNEHFWYFLLHPGGHIDINDIEIKYSYSLTRIPVPVDAPEGEVWNVQVLPYVFIINRSDPEFTGLDAIYPASEKKDVGNNYTAFLTYNSRFNVNWFDLNNFFYSYTEDSTHNGKIDRIRLQSGHDVNGDFSGFKITLTDKATGASFSDAITGFRRVQDDTTLGSQDLNSIYILLDEDKMPFDTGMIFNWEITDNTTLKDLASERMLIGNPEDTGETTDTAPPRIIYALAVPGHDEIYFKLSEPVDNPESIMVTIPGRTASPRSISDKEFVVSMQGASFTINELAGGDDFTPQFTVSGIVDNAKSAEDLKTPAPGRPYFFMYPSPRYPQDYNYDNKTSDPNAYDYKPYVTIAGNPPVSADAVYPANTVYEALTGKAGETIHRVTNMLISVPPKDLGDDNYFIWPLWARYHDDPAQQGELGGFYSADYGYLGRERPFGETGTIWDFTGKRFLEQDDILLQSKVNDKLGLSGTRQILYVFNLSDTMRSASDSSSPGPWPVSFARPINPPFVNLFPEYGSNTITKRPLVSAASGLFNYNFSKTDYPNNGMIEFFFRLDDTPDGLLAGRLDMAAGDQIPGDWYRRVMPFSFGIHDITRQRGGVTILNNVINSNNNERVFVDYKLNKSGRVTIQVFTLDGNLVKVLVRENQAAQDAYYRVAWDGTNNGGRPVARGMYFIRVVAPDIDEIRKVMVVK